MKKIIFALLVVSIVSCGKKRCYTCTTTDYSQSGTIAQPFEKCGTDRQIERFIKNNTHRTNADTNVISPNDVITRCQLQ